MAFTHALSTNNYGPARLIVATSVASGGSGIQNGTHSTLASAMADAASGETIFLRDSVTENVTLTAGVNITAWQGGTLNTPTINGTLTMTTAGTCNISGIRLSSNGAQFLSVTGSAASIVNLNNCYLTTAFDPGITFSSSDSGSQINIYNCKGDISASAKAFFAHSSSGTLDINFTRITNSGSSTTVSTCSAGLLFSRFSSFTFPITTSGTSTISMNNVLFNTTNTTSLTIGGTGGTLVNSTINSGNASSVSIGTALSLFDCSVASTNTNAITGAGTLIYANITFIDTSFKINVTTQSGGIIQGGVFQAPSVGYLGERLESTATSVAMVSGTPKTVTSVSLTAGIWDVYALATTVPTGGTGIATAMSVNISTTDNTIVGTLGIQTSNFGSGTGMSIISGIVPALRVVLTATTTYYLVSNVVYTSTTSPTNGRLSATRVG